MASFPPLEWDDYCWTGSLVLPAWKGFQSRLGAYGSENSTSVSDGSVFLNIVAPDDEKVSPSKQQEAAYGYLLDHQESIRDSVLQAIFSSYRQWQEQYGYEGEEKEELMPDIERPEQLLSLIGLSTVRIFSASKNGLAYMGLEFGCTWDDEHGLGAMIHADRVVEVGGADTAILEWMAEKDV